MCHNGSTDKKLACESLVSCHQSLQTSFPPLPRSLAFLTMYICIYIYLAVRLNARIRCAIFKIDEQLLSRKAGFARKTLDLSICSSIYLSPEIGKMKYQFIRIIFSYLNNSFYRFLFYIITSWTNVLLSLLRFHLGLGKTRSSSNIYPC